MKNEICARYENLIDTELATGQYIHDSFLKLTLKKRVISDEGKRFHGVPVEQPLTMYDTTRKALEVLPKLRFIYGISLFEAFVQDYLAERLEVDIKNLKTALNDLRSKWAKETNNASTSYYNFKYVNFLFLELFNIDIQAEVFESTMEFGDLRKCLVHHGGVVSEGLKNELKETCKVFNLPNEVGTRLFIDTTTMCEFIEDFRRILKICDYE